MAQSATQSVICSPHPPITAQRAVNPHDGRSHHYLGDALAEMGKITEASQCYRRALDLQPQLAPLPTTE